MVPRYSRPAMTALWEPEARFKIWFEIEAHATEKLGELGVVPPSAAKALWDWWATNPAIDVPAIDAIDERTGVGVPGVAFVSMCQERQCQEQLDHPARRLLGSQQSSPRHLSRSRALQHLSRPPRADRSRFRSEPQ